MLGVPAQQNKSFKCPEAGSECAGVGWQDNFLWSVLAGVRQENPSQCNKTVPLAWWALWEEAGHTCQSPQMPTPSDNLLPTPMAMTHIPATTWRLRSTCCEAGSRSLDNVESTVMSDCVSLALKSSSALLSWFTRDLWSREGKQSLSVNTCCRSK